MIGMGQDIYYEDTTYYKGSPEEMNAYLDEKLETKIFSFYYSRKFADFTGLFIGIFCNDSVVCFVFLQDTRKHTYELLHTKPISAGKYILGKVSAGFAVCLLVLAILNILFWLLCWFIQRTVGLK